MEPELEHLRQVEQLYQAALEREASARGPYLAEACSGDEPLRREVESLLVHHGDAGSFLESPAVNDVAKAMAHGEEPPPGGSDATLDDAVPKFIGPYRLLKKLGEGGMGQVWLAEQTAPLRRTVALKLIRAGLYDDSLLQRFQAERQSLAIMDHPSIAKIFDAGATPEGQPYFVMEYVPGSPITAYCDEKRLTIPERLELFIKVCEGVQHAHQKAIIHRDLKPANILVVEVDGKPAPRIIDFGIAKAVSRQPGDDVTVTQAGGFVGTPGYMSPEQAEPGTEDGAGDGARDIDTRTDVYSLGVVLYVLLTGSLPHDTRQWKNLPYDEVLRRLREDGPLRPSTKVSTDREALTAAAEARQTEPRQLLSQLRGDLDSITMKALEKDRDRRYGTPSGLAADIGRYLRNEPVVARPASGGYRARKYVRRHRVGAAIAAGLVMLLVAFSIVQASQLRRTERERDRANRITDFMTDPSQARGNSITAREILDKASKDIDTGLSKDPELQAQMMDIMGNVYHHLGLYPRAESLLARAVDIRRRVLGPENPDTLRSMGEEARSLLGEGRNTEAETLQRQTLDAQRRVLGPEHRGTLTTAADLAWILQAEGHYADAEKLGRQTLGVARRALGPEDLVTLKAATDLAGTLYQEERDAEGEKLQREALDAERRLEGPDDPVTLETMANLALTLGAEGRLAEAEKLQREAIDTERRVLGPEHPNTLIATDNLAGTLMKEGRLSEAEKLVRQTRDIRRHVLGPEHPETLTATTSLAAILTEEGQLAEADKLQRETRDIQLRVLGPDDPQTASSTYNLACIAAHRGRSDAALALLRESVDHGLGPGYDLAVGQDPDLRALHGDPRFEAIVADARQKAAAAQKPK